MEIVKMVFGAHLYGLATSESDTDYKGIYIPSKEDIVMCTAQKSVNITTKSGCGKNTHLDIDLEMFSIHHFIKLACEGQMVALDMLHAPEEMILFAHPIWHKIVAQRERFYTSNLHAFVEYARKQAAKYGIKDSRLNETMVIINLLKSKDDAAQLGDFWNELPDSEHTYHVDDNPNGIKQYQVCGKILQETQRTAYSLDILENFYAKYGQRALKAAKNEGIDWKAVSHAIRAAYEVREILINRTITFPLKEAELLLSIKKGERDYSTEVAPLLEDLITEITTLSALSILPEKVNADYWFDFLRKVETDVL